MSAVVRCLLCLLAVLWVVGWTRASQPQPSAGVDAALEPDQLLSLIVQRVTANIQPLVTKLASRIDGLDARLISLDTRLVSLDSRVIPRLSSIETRLNALDSNQDMFDAKLDGLASRMDSEENRLDARHDELVARVNSTELRLDSKLDDLTSQLSSTNNGLDSGLNDLVSRVDELVNERNVRLANVSSRVDGDSSRLDGVSSRLDGISSRLNSVSSSLEELVNLTDPRLQPPSPRDCSDLLAGSRSGIHLLQPDPDRSWLPVKAYCDLEADGGRWTVIQRRADIQPRQNFNRSWSEYREGFGDLEAEFWWGLENLWRLTGSQDRHYELRVNLADFDGGRRHAFYGTFRVASGVDGYRLTVSDYAGDAKDSLGPHDGARFSTYDREHDTRDTANCAAYFGGGWWHVSCYDSNLNGQYLSGQQNKDGGINWKKWRGYKYSLKETEMKIRPVDTD